MDMTAVPRAGTGTRHGQRIISRGAEDRWKPGAGQGAESCGRTSSANNSPGVVRGSRESYPKARKAKKTPPVRGRFPFLRCSQSFWERSARPDHGAKARVRSTGLACFAELEVGACRSASAAPVARDGRCDAVFELAGSFVSFEEEVADPLQVCCGDGHDSEDGEERVAGDGGFRARARARVQVTGGRRERHTGRGAAGSLREVVRRSATRPLREDDEPMTRQAFMARGGCRWSQRRSGCPPHPFRRCSTWRGGLLRESLAGR